MGFLDLRSGMTRELPASAWAIETFSGCFDSALVIFARQNVVHALRSTGQALRRYGQGFGADAAVPRLYVWILAAVWTVFSIQIEACIIRTCEEYPGAQLPSVRCCSSRLD